MKLCFFTNSYPYGNGETFIENEIKYLSAKFEKVYIFPFFIEGSARELPANTFVVDLHSTDKLNNFKYLLTFPSSLVNGLIYLCNLFFSLRINKSNFRYILSYYKQLLITSTLLFKWLKKNNCSNYIFYSYWFIDWATILSILKKNNIIKDFHARAHGYDIYNERHSYGFIPFRECQLTQVTTVSAASKAGYEYLKNKFPCFHFKFKWYRLGVEDNGINLLDTNNGNLTIVSCSNVIDIKRVDLIIEILMFIKCKVNWIHFGDGPLLNKVRELAKILPINVTYDFRGRVPNKNILSFYSKHSVNLFITTTETEGGCPVSIQEAISFGIPVIATNVGGIPEVVTPHTGWLIDKSFNPKEVASLITANLEKINSFSFRLNVRSFWKSEFNGKLNFTRYIDEVLLT